MALTRVLKLRRGFFFLRQTEQRYAKTLPEVKYNEDRRKKRSKWRPSSQVTHMMGGYEAFIRHTHIQKASKTVKLVVSYLFMCNGWAARAPSARGSNFRIFRPTLEGGGVRWRHGACRGLCWVAVIIISTRALCCSWNSIVNILLHLRHGSVPFTHDTRKQKRKESR